MEIEITETKRIKKIINLDLPYYFRHDLDDSAIYGKLGEETCTTIQITLHSRRPLQGAEIEIETIDWDSLSCYLAQEYKSNEAEYLIAKQKALLLLERA